MTRVFSLALGTPRTFNRRWRFVRARRAHLRGMLEQCSGVERYSE